MIADPRQWLVDLEEPGAYERMLEDAGCLEFAAWRLAYVKCRLNSQGDVPSSLELRAAAREIVERSGLTTTVPTAMALKSMCEAAGLWVV